MASPAPILRPGDQLACVDCTTRVVVIRAPAQGSPSITCGGRPMVAAGSAPSPPPDGDAVTLVGKRYADTSEALELLCTASGPGALGCDGVAMTRKTAKPLPASD